MEDMHQPRASRMGIALETEQTLKHIISGLVQRHIGIQLPSDRREIRWECLAIPLAFLELKAAPRGSQESTKKQVDRIQSLRREPV